MRSSHHPFALTFCLFSFLSAMRTSQFVKIPLPWSRTEVLLPLALMVLTFLLKLPFWSRPLDMDEGLYAYGGWQMLEGLVLYRDLWDFKPPGTYFLNAFAFLVGSPEAVNVYIWAALFSSSACLGLYRTAGIMWGRAAAVLSAILFALFSVSPYIQGCGVNTEVFMITPLAWGFYAIIRGLEEGRRRWYVFSGLLIGTAILFKQVAGVGVLLGLFVAHYNTKQGRLTQREALLSLSVFAGGCALPWFVACCYFAFHGALGDLYFWLVEYPSRYMNFTFGYLTPNLVYPRIGWVLQGTWTLWVLSIAALPLVMRRSASCPERVLAIFFFLCLLGITAGWNFFPHYFIQLLPAMVLLSVKAVLSVYSVLSGRSARVGLLLCSGVILCIVLLYGKNHYKIYTTYTGDDISVEENRWGFGGDSSLFVAARKLGLDLRRNTRSNETIFVWKHHPEINFYALRKTPVRSPIMSLPRLPVMRPQAIQDMQRNNPDYIVLFDLLSPFRFEELTSFLQNRYVKVYGINGLVFAEQGVYKRKPNE